jgi:hypothetical protein
MKNERPTYALRIRAEPGVDAIRALRAWLKRGLRDFGLRCLELQQQKETDMPIDLNNADREAERPLISPGVYRLRTRVKAGGEGDDCQLARAKNGVTLHLTLECTVVEGKHHGQKVWDHITCELDEQGTITPLPADKRESLQASVRMGRKKLKAILDSAYDLDPNDTISEEATTKRSFDSYKAFDGLIFYAQIEQRPAANGYAASNTIDFIVTPDLPDYPKTKDGKTLVPVKPPLQDDMGDEIPF